MDCCTPLHPYKRRAPWACVPVPSILEPAHALMMGTGLMLACLFHVFRWLDKSTTTGLRGSPDHSRMFHLVWPAPGTNPSLPARAFPHTLSSLLCPSLVSQINCCTQGRGQRIKTKGKQIFSGSKHVRTPGEVDSYAAACCLLPGEMRRQLLSSFLSSSNSTTYGVPLGCAGTKGASRLPPAMKHMDKR